MVPALLTSAFVLNGIGVAVLVYAHMQRKGAARTVEDAQNEANLIRRNVEAERKEKTAELQQELHDKRHNVNNELRKRQAELDEKAARIASQRERLDEREKALKQAQNDLSTEQEKLQKAWQRIHELEQQAQEYQNTLVQRLEHVSGMTCEEARQQLMDNMRSQAEQEHERWLARAEEEIKHSAKERAQTLLVDAMQRYASEHVSLNAASVVHLPNDDMKGRIIGREGRNIKALELATGMEFVIGDTPEVITISGFNPIRREIARRSLERLVNDGRINPTRIEETVGQIESEIEEIIYEKGKSAVLQLNLQGVHSDIITLLGRLHFRTSYSQNVLSHSIEVAHMARMLAEELGLPRPDLAARAGLFHDMGKSASEEYEGPHAHVGADIARKCGEDQIVVNAIAAHHEEVPFKSLYDPVVLVADTISASRPGARRETLAAYIKRLEQLENIARGFGGVKKAYALQAGREVRIIVEEDDVSDSESMSLSRSVADAVQQEMHFPGHIKINVIREKRSIEYAK